MLKRKKGEIFLGLWMSAESREPILGFAIGPMMKYNVISVKLHILSRALLFLQELVKPPESARPLDHLTRAVLQGSVTRLVVFQDPLRLPSLAPFLPTV